MSERRYRTGIEYEITAGRVAFQKAAGDLLGYSGWREFVPDAEGTLLVHRSRLAYGLGAPWVLARGAVTRHVRRLIGKLGDEAERRTRAEEEAP